MRRNFKPMPGDHIDDEDAGCFVRHQTFVEKDRRARDRRRAWSDFGFALWVAACAVAIGGTLYLIFTHPVH